MTAVRGKDRILVSPAYSREGDMKGPQPISKKLNLCYASGDTKCLLKGHSSGPQAIASVVSVSLGKVGKGDQSTCFYHTLLSRTLLVLITEGCCILLDAF